MKTKKEKAILGLTILGGVAGVAVAVAIPCIFAARKIARTLKDLDVGKEFGEFLK